jgi:hypothetical protein
MKRMYACPRCGKELGPDELPHAPTYYPPAVRGERVSLHMALCDQCERVVDKLAAYWTARFNQQEGRDSS